MQHVHGEFKEPSTVVISTDNVALHGDLVIPPDATGIVVFAHGSGSSRSSPRNRAVAQALQRDGLGTLLFDLLTQEEEIEERYTRHLRFDIPLLANRLAGVVEWLEERDDAAALPVGLFGASTGAAAALIAATRTDVRAVVSRGGRPDLAEDALRQVRAPTLLVVGGDDVEVLELNRKALRRIMAPARLQIVPDAGHLFEEPGTLDEVIRMASAWFQKYLPVEPQRDH
jgi:dienelactone hydrolase